MYNSHPDKLWASPPMHASNYLVLWEQWFLSIDNSGSRLGLSTGQVESISGSNWNLTMISTAWSSTYGCWIRSELTMMDHKGGWDGDRLLGTPSHPPQKKKNAYMPTSDGLVESEFNPWKLTPNPNSSVLEDLQFMVKPHYSSEVRKYYSWNIE